MDTAVATTDGLGGYTLEIHGDPWCTTWVIASAPTYNAHAESFILNPWDMGLQSFQLKETPCNRVLIYRGNGGDTGLPLGDFTTLAVPERVDDTAVFPGGDLLEYKTIILVVPGLADDAVPGGIGSGSGPNAFTIDQIARLQAWVNSICGSSSRRLVLLGEGVVDTDPATSAFSNAVLNDLLVRMSLADAPQTYGVQFSVLLPTVGDAIADDYFNITQVTDGPIAVLGTNHFSNTCDTLTVDPTAPSPALDLALLNAAHATNAGDTVVAGTVVPGSPGTTGNGADVILVGDTRWASDLTCSLSAATCFHTGDNDDLAANLLYGY
jgi:hypothetical protein